MSKPLKENSWPTCLLELAGALEGMPPALGPVNWRVSNTMLEVSPLRVDCAIPCDGRRQNTNDENPGASLNRGFAIPQVSARPTIGLTGGARVQIPPPMRADAWSELLLADLLVLAVELVADTSNGSRRRRGAWETRDYTGDQTREIKHSTGPQEALKGWLDSGSRRYSC